MKRLLLLALLLLPLASDVGAQSGSNFTSAGNYCHVVGPPDNWLPCDSTTPLVVSLAGGSTSGGTPLFFLQPTASDNHAVIKAGAGTVWKITVTNNSGTTNYIRLYNATTGFAGCGSATGLMYQAAVISPGIADSYAQGIAFSTGISICVTSGYATTDTTNATASAMSVNVAYQ